MQTRVAYGDTGLWLDVPDDSTIVTPSHRPAAVDQRQAVRDALRRPVAGPPLRERVSRGQTVAISACDITRPQPRQVMIPVLLEELDGIVDLDDVVVLVATGTHRANTPEELRAMFGDEVGDSVRIVNHDSRDAAALTWVGRRGNDVPVWLNREWTMADIRITTGFVEPHFFAGFSGGPKMVAPGLAALDTVLVLHDAVRIGDPRATWCITHGNPVHDDVRAIGEATGVTFAVDVVLNTEQAIVQAFGGDLLAMHEAATGFAKEVAMQPVDGWFDVVLTTGSAIRRPEPVPVGRDVGGPSRPGGTIVCAAEAVTAFPSMVRTARSDVRSPERLLPRSPAATAPCPTSGSPDPGADPEHLPGRAHQPPSPTRNSPPRWSRPGHHRHYRAGAALRRLRRRQCAPEGPRPSPSSPTGPPEHDSGTEPGD
jgi:hypothetical protein